MVEKVFNLFSNNWFARYAILGKKDFAFAKDNLFPDFVLYTCGTTR